MGTLEKAGFNITEMAEEVRGEKEKHDAVDEWQIWRQLFQSSGET